MSWSDCLRILRAGWLIVLGCALVGFGLGYGASRAVTPTYTATTSVYFSPRSVQSGTDLAQGATFTRDQMESYATLATQPVVLEPVIRELGLDTTPRALAPQITAVSPKKTVVLRIDVTDSDPQQAAQIANATARHLGQASSELAPTSNGISTIKATPVSEATAPSSPSSPNTRRNAAAGLLAGLFLGVLLALGRGIVDTRVRSSEDLTKATDAPLIGEIPLGRSRAGQARVTYSRPDAPEADAYRRLRTNLAAVSSPDGAQTLAVTSAQEGEGKTVTAINLAVVAAEAGARVLLIDANLAQPSIAAYTGLPDRRGLSDALADGLPVVDLIQPLIPDALDVLTSGPVPDHANALLGSPALHALLSDVTERYDIVLIDAPSMATSAAPLLMALNVSGLIVVSSASVARRAQVHEAVAALRRVEANVTGIVLNEVRPSHQGRRPSRRWRRGSRRTSPSRYEFQPLLRTKNGRGSRATRDAHTPDPDLRASDRTVWPPADPTSTRIPTRRSDAVSARR